MVAATASPRTSSTTSSPARNRTLQPLAFETFDELHDYCYRVAGVVGLASIYVWGFDGGAETEELAVDRGIAFQLTNILRDLKEDAARGRIYLPQARRAHGASSERRPPRRPRQRHRSST